MRKTVCILVVAVGLMGCSSPKSPTMELSQKRIKEVNARIDETVPDPARAQAMKEVIDDFDRQMQTHLASLQQKRDAIVNASADYATTGQDLEALYVGVDSEMREVFERIKEAYTALMEQATPEEWAAITRGKKRLFSYN